MDMSNPRPTADRIRALAERHQVHYVETKSDVLAHHMTRLADNFVVLDDIEKMLIALQRAGHVSRIELVRLQAAYLREVRP